MLITITINVGDRVRPKNRPGWPNATVTEITPRGFKWRLDEPYFLGSRIGWLVGGEECGLDHWEPVRPGEHDPRKLQWDEAEPIAGPLTKATSK